MSFRNARSEYFSLIKKLINETFSTLGIIKIIFITKQMQRQMNRYREAAEMGKFH